ncbi:hypothetical protein GWK08_14535 [Leptobacterium flavescens]|uniref:RDD domain-containing protein n=1 Tax=Leptobacterium flavescens TaxID=472055 RepID=A0A6P0UQB8_9FLAO|nr:RDD family protein [Leptobacterium flavescens]NER14670.1 hypothetical protein [Leptobacterium flavescens]
MKEVSKESFISLRVLATIIDYTLMWSLLIIYVVKFGESTADGYQVSGLKALIPFGFWFIYFPISEWAFKSTLGHWTVGLKVISENESELTLGQTVKRRLSDIFEISWCFGLVAFIVVNNNDKRQRVGDLISKTLVVKR